MKKVLNAIVLTLAANVVLAAGGIGWLASSGHLTKQRMADVRRVLFPPPVTQPATPTTRAAVVESNADPATRLGNLVARAAGRPPAERLAAVQEAADAQAAELERRRRELLDIRQQVELAQDQTARDRDAVARDRQAFAAQRDQQAAAAADKGFQDSLELYRTLPPRQVKAIFASLPDETVQQYLEAMDARQAGKIMKEYKSPADLERLQRVLEKIRQAASEAPATPAAGTMPAPVSSDPSATAAVPQDR